MARCPSCNRFVGVEQEEPECDLDIETEKMDSLMTEQKATIQKATITGEVKLVLLCGECGEETQETTIDVEEFVTFEHMQAGCEGELEVDGDATATDWFEGKGRPKHFYGADMSCNIDCSGCGATQNSQFTVGEQASNFEDV